MVDKRLVFILHQHTDTEDAGIDHIGQHKIHNAVAPAKRYGCHGAVFCNLTQVIIGVKGDNDAKYVFHVHASLLLLNLVGEVFACHLFGAEFCAAPNAGIGSNHCNAPVFNFAV